MGDVHVGLAGGTPDHLLTFSQLVPVTSPVLSVPLPPFPPALEDPRSREVCRKIATDGRLSLDPHARLMTP